jgi:CHAD domain-containing protein
MKTYPVKAKKSLRENIQIILPMMFDDFMSYHDRVLGHPRLKTELHRMRITGKPMRYAMEYAESAFGKNFKYCLEEIKNIIELMGEIHDCDATIPEIALQLRELRQFNRTLSNNGEKFSTSGLIGLIKELKQKRNKLYDDFSSILEKWVKESFRTKLISSMGVYSRLVPRA